MYMYSISVHGLWCLSMNPDRICFCTVLPSVGSVAERPSDAARSPCCNAEGSRLNLPANGWMGWEVEYIKNVKAGAL